MHKDEESGERKGILIPQFEIVIEAEEELPDDCKTEEERVQEFERIVQEGKAGTLQGLLVLFLLEVCHCNLYKISWLC